MFGFSPLIQNDPPRLRRDYLPSQAVDAGEDADVIVTNVNPKGAETRNVQELQAQIKAGGGQVSVDPNSSLYIVAVNNPLRFTVTKQADGTFTVKQSAMFLYLIALVGVGGLLLLAKR